MRLRLAVLLAASSGALALASVAHASSGASATLAEQRAVETYALMERYFYVAAARTYNGTYPMSGRAQVWPYSQALSARLAIARLPDGGHRARAAVLAGIARLALYQAPLRDAVAYAPVYGGKGNPFYDDNAWIGIELVDAGDAFDKPAYLVDARRLFAWLERGWDTKGRGCPGGVYWLMPGGKYWNRSPGSRYRTAVSTANAALLATLLYEHMGRRGYLDWAERAYRWSRRCLGRANGLIADHIDASGVVTTTIHSYNQGAIIATAVNLYRITHERSYLADAVRTTDASLAAFHDPLGSGEEVAFLAIFYGDLLQLTPMARRDAIRRAITAFGDRAWAEERDPTTGLFRFGHTKATLLDQAAMVQIYAQLASADQVRSSPASTRTNNPYAKRLARQGSGWYLAVHGTWLSATNGAPPRCARSLPAGGDGRGAGIRLRDDQAAARPRPCNRRRGLHLSVAGTSGA